MAKAKSQMARVLVACIIHGVQLQCNQLVESDAETINNMVANGQADDNPKAVEYCLKELKAKPVQVVAPVDKAAAIAEAQAALKKAEEAAAAAKTPDEKALAHKSVDDAKAALEALA
jgi:antirestriction protein